MTLDTEPLYDFAALQMALDDFVQVTHVLVPIPYPFGIDDDHGPLAATSEAAGNIDPYPARRIQPQLADPRLGVITEPAGAMILAGSPPVIPAIGAEKHMSTVEHAAKIQESRPRRQAGMDAWAGGAKGAIL